MKEMNSIMDLWDMDKGKKSCEQKSVTYNPQQAQNKWDFCTFPTFIISCE